MVAGITGSLWAPEDEEAITVALAEGTFVESHWVDAKASTGDSDGERKETARDLASFAIDGGVLVIGVGENKKAGTFFPAPITLANAVEKIEQVAQTRIQPPLTVRVREIRTAADPGKGYLVVTIPASPDAPHQADGRYYGRGERTRRALSDAEVRRMLADRAATGDALRERLSELSADERTEERATLYFAARPIGAPREMALELVREPNHRRIAEITQQAAASPPPPGYREQRRSVTEAYQPVPVQRGIGFASVEGGRLPGVEVHHFESGAVEVIFRDIVTEERSDRRLEDQYLVYWTAEAVALVAGVAAACGFHGAWDVSVLVSRLQGVPAMNVMTGFPPKFRGPDYFESTRVDAIALQVEQGAVVRALLAPLLRDLEAGRTRLPEPDGTWGP